MLLVLSSLTLSRLAPDIEPIRAVKTARKVIALTFDACQDKNPAGYDEKIIAILRENKVKATLFLGGAWAESHSKVCLNLGRDPLFEIGQHSYRHPHFARLNATDALSDIVKAQNSVTKASGRRPRLFRPPFGEWDTKTLKLAHKLGLKVVLWSIVTGDPDKHVSAKSIAQTVLTNAKPGSIVIMHMNGRGWHTAEALPELIKRLRTKGYTFATVSELISL